MAEVRVAFQGERGAYSEAAVFELLGRESVAPRGYASFDDVYAAVANNEVDLGMVPIENSLGGTIHANCDLQLRHNLFIIAEHELRVRHCLMALPGTTMDQVTKVMSHPQALAQCDSYLRRAGKVGEASYDTAGSAKLIAEGRLEGAAAICSEHAAEHYGLELLDRGIEDDSKNFTRFLLLRRSPLRAPRGAACKTSIVFSMSSMGTSGALFKALSVFALRNIDISKVESRPCKPDVMDKLEQACYSMHAIWKQGASAPKHEARDRFEYLVYLDLLAAADEPNFANAMSHLQEVTTFLRVLGSYPRAGSFQGLGNLSPGSLAPSAVAKRRLGILGFGAFGQFMAKRLARDFSVYATSRSSYPSEAAELGVVWCGSLEELLAQNLDVIVVAVSVLSFEAVVRRLAAAMEKLESVASKPPLVVDVLSVKVHAKSTMSALLPDCCDILCTHPMFGPQSAEHSWASLPLVFERVRLRDALRCEQFLRWWTEQGCRLVDMSCELHDEASASSQFITHLTGRVVERLNLRASPIHTKGFEALQQLVSHTCSDSFDLFQALYKYNPSSEQALKTFEDAVTEITRDLHQAPAEGSAGGRCPQA